MKYKLTDKFIEYEGRKFYQIQAEKDFYNVKAGEFGGYIENTKNLDQDNNAWVFWNARVYDNAQVFRNAWVFWNARVFGNALVYGDAWICGDAIINDKADYITLSSLGKEPISLTVFRNKNNDLYYNTDYFSGTEEDFVNTIDKKYAGNNHAKAYKLAIQLAKTIINLDDL